MRQSRCLSSACCPIKCSFYYQIASEGEGAAADTTLCRLTLLLKRKCFRGSNFCPPGSFSRSQQNNTLRKSINKACAPEADAGGSHLTARGREVRRECGTHLRAGQEEGGAFMLSRICRPPLKRAESSGSGRCGTIKELAPLNGVKAGR